MFRALRRLHAEWRLDVLTEEMLRHGSAHCKGVEPCHYWTRACDRLEALLREVAR